MRWRNKANLARSRRLKKRNIVKNTENIIFFAMLKYLEDKLHDKMTSAYSKSCGYKKFSVHTNTKKYRFQIVPLWKAFSKGSVFVDFFYADINVLVWTEGVSVTIKLRFQIYPA